ELIKYLKTRGYKIYILSNIWPMSLELLYNKFPTLEALFDGAYIPQASNGFIAKPHPSFYEGFKYYLAQQNQAHKQIIFIDNRKKNIKAARQAGLIALKFSSAKELVDKLIHLKTENGLRPLPV